SSAFGGSVPAILMNTPGQPMSACTAFDGYPMAKQGKAKEALGAAAFSSFFGALFGVIILVLCLPIIKPMVLLLGPPEWFFLALFGLTLIAGISERSMLTGLIAGIFGLMLSFHGANTVTGGIRYNFNTVYLLDGISFLPVLMGLFAIAEMIYLATEAHSISENEVEIKGSIKEGLFAIFRHKKVFFQSSIIGVIVGAVPGVGGTVANFIAYVRAKQISKHPETFGKGNIEGIIASEASNDAKDGGALMPLLALGIPGSTSTAILLGALTMHGIVPGAAMLNENLNLTFVLIFTLVIANIITSTIGLAASTQMAKITKVPTKILAPIVIIFTLVGSYGTQKEIMDVVMAAGFGVIGYVMKKTNFPRIPIVLGLVLGPIAESSFHTSMQFSNYNYSIFFTRPICIILMLAILASFIVPVIKSKKLKKN
ncbi:MAG: tripartite tricarboxylate transporter permease, partial [Sphaerochaetaceae bacterium]